MKFLSQLHAPIYASRIRVLVELITPHLRQGDKVLDVGCGSGQLGHALLNAQHRPDVLEVAGLEKYRRGNEPIPVTGFSGGTFPFPDNSFDVVIVADVLHHEENPDALVAECVRVSRRLLIIKDHQVCGPLAYSRISLIDWAANAPYGVKCLFRYNKPEEWNAFVAKWKLRVLQKLGSIDLYPPVVNWLFGRRLQCMIVAHVPDGE